MTAKQKQFEGLCAAAAARWFAGEFEWIGHAVDPLQRWVKDHGLIDEIGQNEVQRIMADAFTPEKERHGRSETKADQ